MLNPIHMFQKLCCSLVSHISIETATNFSKALILCYASVTLSQLGELKGLHPLEPSHLESLTHDSKRFNTFWTYQ